MSALLQTALSLASRGLHVFPCRPRDKQPAVYNGVKRATIDQDVITGWWRSTEYNIGLATGAQSRVFVVDIDGVDAEAELAKLEQQHDALPRTVESLTARGRHVYFAWPDRLVRNSASKIAPGIDVRGEGGYVLAPPSVHPSGKEYCWSVDSADNFASAPQWLLAKIVAPARRDNGVGGAAQPRAGAISSAMASVKANATTQSRAWPDIYCAVMSTRLLRWNSCSPGTRLAAGRRSLKMKSLSLLTASVAWK